MDLKAEYLKRIKILQSKQEQRKFKIQIENDAFIEKETEIKNKIIFLKKKIFENEKTTLFNENELIRLNDIDYSNIKKNINITYLDDKFLLEENVNKFSLEEKKIIKDFDLRKQKLNLELSHQKSEFIKKNEDNINKLQKLEKEINNLNNILSKKEKEIKNEIKNNELTLQLRFITRNKNISILENSYNKLKYKRKERNKIKKNIILKEKEINKIENTNIFFNNKKLKSLNTYIKQQKLNFKNNLPPQIKKNIFQNIKQKTLEYNKILKEQKDIKESEERKINNLKNEYEYIDLNCEGNIICNKLSNNKIISQLKKEIKELKYQLHILKVERKIMIDIVDDNDKKNNKYIDEIKEKIQNNYDLQEIALFENELIFENIKNEIINKKNLEQKFNKKQVYELLNNNILKLFNKKKNSIYKKNIEESLIKTRKELKDDIRKLKNNEYILKNMKIKYNLSLSQKEEENNLNTIDELIEIQDLKHKLLSL